MFTLKMFRHNPHLEGVRQTLVTKIVECHHVDVMEIGQEGHALELHVYQNPNELPTTYYIGEPEKGMDAYGKDDNHLKFDGHSWWLWGLLENANGKTSQHFRPASYGVPR